MKITSASSRAYGLAVVNRYRELSAASALTKPENRLIVRCEINEHYASATRLCADSLTGLEIATAFHHRYSLGWIQHEYAATVAGSICRRSFAHRVVNNLDLLISRALRRIVDVCLARLVLVVDLTAISSITALVLASRKHIRCTLNPPSLISAGADAQSPHIVIGAVGDRAAVKAVQRQLRGTQRPPCPLLTLPAPPVLDMLTFTLRRYSPVFHR